MVGYRNYEHVASMNPDQGPNDADEMATHAAIKINNAWYGLLEAIKQCHKAGIPLDMDSLSDLLGQAHDELSAAYINNYEEEVAYYDDDQQTSYGLGLELLPDTDIEQWIKKELTT